MYFGDNGRTKKANMRAESKKSKVLRLAQRDPFLSVDEIAGLVGTTSRYVRTSLCEAGLTLTGLRRRYAAAMKRRIAVAERPHAIDGDAGMDAVAMRVCEGAPGTGGTSRHSNLGHRMARPTGVRVALTLDPEAARVLETDPHVPLLEISRVHVENGLPLCVMQLVTNRPCIAGEQLLVADEPLRTLLDVTTAEQTPGSSPGDIDGDVQDSVRASPAVSDKRIVDIVPATEFLAKSLGLKSGHPILRSGTVVTVGRQPVAVEYKYFDGMRVRFELDAASRREPQVTERIRQASHG